MSAATDKLAVALDKMQQLSKELVEAKGSLATWQKTVDDTKAALESVKGEFDEAQRQVQQEAHDLAIS